MAENMMGYSVEDQAIIDSLHKKLNPQEAKPAVPASAVAPATQDADLTIPGEEPSPDEPIAEVEQPEGEAAPEVAAEPLATLKVRIKDEEGKDVCRHAETFSGNQQQPIAEQRLNIVRRVVQHFGANAGSSVYLSGLAQLVSLL